VSAAEPGYQGTVHAPQGDRDHFVTITPPDFAS
jgi:hypothetical protein